jgi:hypothetical protein
MCLLRGTGSEFNAIQGFLVCKISLPSNTTGVRVRSRINPCEICGRQWHWGNFFSLVLRSSPANTFAPTLRSRRLGSCQKATFFKMLGNNGEKVLSLSSERVYYANWHVRCVSLVWTAVSFIYWVTWSSQFVSTGRQWQRYSTTELQHYRTTAL